MIVHFVSNQSETAGGVPRSSRELARALAVSGEDVELWTTDFSFVPELEAGSEAGSSSDRGLVTKSFALSSPRALLRSRGLLAELRRRRSEIQGLHVHGVWFPAGSQLMKEARRLGIPYVIRPAGMLAGEALRLHGLKKRWYWRLFEKHNVEGAAALQYSCDREMESDDSACRPKGPERFSLPNGLSPEFLAHLEGPPPSESEVLFEGRDRKSAAPFPLAPRIGTVGRIDPMKRFDRLVDAARLLRADWPSLSLEIAGADTEGHTDELVRGIDASRMASHVRLLGHLDLPQKVGFLRGLDVFVCSSDFESFGIAILEALALGIPAVVTSGVAISAELDRCQAAIVVDPEPKAIADGVHRILRDRDLGRAISRNGRAFSKKFRWREIAGRLRERYETIFPMRKF